MQLLDYYWYSNYTSPIIVILVTMVIYGNLHIKVDKAA